MKTYFWKKGDTIIAANTIEFYLKSDVVARDAKIRLALRNPLHTDEFNIREALLLLEGST